MDEREELLRRYAMGNRLQVSQNPYAAGNKRYGVSGRDAPNIGPSDPTGYKERDAKAGARRNAVLRKLKARRKGAYASEDAQNPVAQPQRQQELNQLLGWYY
jgi:hypothetical protein